MRGTETRGRLRGHLLAAGAILVWGTTFITSKVLLREFSTVQVMEARFLIAYLTMLALEHKRRKTEPRDELLFLLLAVTGTTLYFVFENSALTVTYASHVSILLSAAPILTALLAHFFTREKLTAALLGGSAAAFAGVALVVFNGSVVLRLRPAGDLLCIGAALSWAVYSVLLGRALERFDSLFLTRRVLFYAVLTTAPLLLFEHRAVPWAAFLRPGIAAGFLFLGVLGSGVCYAVWNAAVRVLGVVATNNYIYFSPFITMAAAALLLGEPITPMGVAGTLLILAGVFTAGLKKRPAQKEPVLKETSAPQKAALPAGKFFSEEKSDA